MLFTLNCKVGYKVDYRHLIVLKVFKSVIETDNCPSRFSNIPYICLKK